MNAVIFLFFVGVNDLLYLSSKEKWNFFIRLAYNSIIISTFATNKLLTT